MRKGGSTIKFLEFSTATHVFSAGVTTLTGKEKYSYAIFTLPIYLLTISIKNYINF